MNVDISSYCRLEFFCFLGLEKSGISKKEKCFLFQDFSEFIDNENYDVYAEDYDNISSVISRISEIGKEFDTKYHLGFQNYWNVMIDENEEEQEIGAASVMLYNKWGNDLIVAVLFDKWMIPSHTYESYENYKYRNNNKRSVILQLPDYSMFSENEFISNKVASLMIKEWLDTNDIDTDLYYQ
jgi:hypothetical protein